MKTYGRASRLSRLFLVSATFVPLLAGAQAGKTVTLPAVATTSVASVKVAREQNQTAVRVEGSGPLRYHVSRESDPPRVVVDFTDARLAVPRYAIPSSYEPVRGVRLAQFQPDQVRLVVDLTHAAVPVIGDNGKALVITFSDSAASQNPSAVTAHPVKLSTAAGDASKKQEFPLPVSLTSRSAAMATPRPQATSSAAAVPAAQGLPSTPRALAVAPQEAGAQRFTGEPISVNLRDVDLKDFFRLIHEISGLNVVLDPSVRGTVTLVLDEVPWDQALDIVLRNNGLAKEIDGNVLRIVTQDTLRKEAEEHTALQKAQSDAVEPVTSTRVLSYAKASELVVPLRRFLSPRGDILAQDRANMLIIRDIPSVMPQVDNLIRQMDRKTQQVEIEARVVQASRSFARDIGTQFGFAGVTNTPRSSNLFGGAPTANNGSPISHPASGPQPPLVTAGGTNIPLNSNFPAVAPTSGLAFEHISPNFALDYIITAAESRGVGKLLSSPRLVTQNNATATVKQGTQIPIQTTINNTISVQYIDAVLKLQVTPQITVDGTVFMDVLVENTQVDNGIPRVNGIPALNTQSAQTKVLIGDGGTVVVGGVMVSQQQTNVFQVPLVGSVPLIGHLFKRTAVDVTSQELLFFVTPRITPG